MRIAIDTTSSGADIRQAVTGFPLLVRLSASNFDFAHARHDGADVRFLDTDGKALSHEIERWDAQRELAELWVLLPRVESASKDNVVHMYWGNSLAAPVSAGSEVFGDLACALHMVRDSDGIASHLQDSSGRANTALMQGSSTAATQPDGVSGLAIGLDGSSGYLATSTVTRSPQTFSLSVWLKTTGTPPAAIAGFADKQTGSVLQFDRAISMDDRGRLSFGVLRGSTLTTVASLTSYSDGAWHHVVARLSDGGQYLFVDGESIADDPTSSGANDYIGFWRFGEDPLIALTATHSAGATMGNLFAGVLDEIRIAISAQSDAWIKLAYATQRPDTTVVSYQAL
jgi:hypothetical protein